MKKTSSISIISLGIFILFLLSACGSGGEGGSSGNLLAPTEETLWTAAEGSYRISGNGYNYPINTDEGSMGLNVVSSTLWGWLRYYYPDMNLISTSITEVIVERADNGYRATITGDGTVQGNSGYKFTAIVYATESDYKMALSVFNPGGSLHFQADLKEIGSKGYFRFQPYEENAI